MANVYVFQAALLCEECGKAERACRPALDALSDAELGELGFDSNDIPMGPYSGGGGEADCPQHCDNCGVFLENPLTSAGIAYVRNAVADQSRYGRSVVVEKWKVFYEIME